MQRLCFLIIMCTSLLCSSIATAASKLSESSLNSGVWVIAKTDKPYRSFLSGSNLLSHDQPCEDAMETCKIINLSATPLTVNTGKLFMQIGSYDGSNGCVALFDDIHYSNQNNTLDVPSASYVTKWRSSNNSDSCPSSSLTLTISNAQEFNGAKVYSFNIVES